MRDVGRAATRRAVARTADAKPKPEGEQPTDELPNPHLTAPRCVHVSGLSSGDFVRGSTGARRVGRANLARARHALAALHRELSAFLIPLLEAQLGEHAVALGARHEVALGQ